MEVGLVLACVLFVRRMATLFKVHATSADGLAWRLHGALFFGATDKLDVLLEAAQTVPVGSTMTLDMAALFALDTTGLIAWSSCSKHWSSAGPTWPSKVCNPKCNLCWSARV